MTYGLILLGDEKTIDQEATTQQHILLKGKGEEQ